VKWKLYSLLAAWLATSVAFGGTLTVTSPTEGAFLGKTNNVRVNVSGAVVEVTVNVLVTDPQGGEIRLNQKFTPDNRGEFQGSIPLNFNDAAPQGVYTINVTATEPGNAYNSVTLTVNVDVVQPEFLQISPTNNSFVQGLVPIRVSIREPNVKEWRVQINGQDIPNNTGSTSSFVVNWDSSGILTDGRQEITVKVTDLAGNEATQTIDVTLDRVPPQIAIETPRNGGSVAPNSRISVVARITDNGLANSVLASNVIVTITDVNGKFLGRVARALAQNQAGELLWIGRIRRGREVPDTFKVVVDAIDRAGNKAVGQVVTVYVGQRGRRR
jgi:hypothetical protein